MIKAAGTGADGKRVVIFGLSEGNVARLREGKPMVVDLVPLGLEGTVLILYGETEEDIARELAQHVELPA